MKNQLTINLFGPGMTVLHKAGLAGLWMTLAACPSNGWIISRSSGK
jgi:hypothetical protein